MSTDIESFSSASDDENECHPDKNPEIDPIRLWQLKLSKQKKKLIMIKSRINSFQTQLEEQDERLKSLQEEIAKRRAAIKKKRSDLTAVRTAHLVSRVFALCEPAPPSKEPETGTDEIVNPSSKCLYTAEFHRFAIALYFFSPKAYFFLSNIAPMFPHRNYIRQWVTSGKVEKLFPHGVYNGDSK